MILFLRNIPADTLSEDINNFVASAVIPRWYLPLRQTGIVLDTCIFKAKHPYSREICYHGLAEVEPALTAALAILKLNGMNLAGKMVEVRRWYERSAELDRRHEYSEDYLPSVDRRRKDRRINPPIKPSLLLR